MSKAPAAPARSTRRAPCAPPRPISPMPGSRPSPRKRLAKKELPLPLGGASREERLDGRGSNRSSRFDGVDEAAVASQQIKNACAAERPPHPALSPKGERGIKIGVALSIAL